MGNKYKKNSSINRKKVLFVSNSTADRISFIREGFSQLDFLEVSQLYLLKDDRTKSLLTRILTKLKIPPDLDRLNHRLVIKVRAENPDIIFIVKGNLIYPSTLKMLKEQHPFIKLVSFSNDNMSLWHNKSLFYHYGVKYYDLLVSINIPAYKDIKDRFSKKIIYVDKSYSPKYHYYEPLEKKYDVIFIGSYEYERYQDLQYLASKGIKVDVFGNMWDKTKLDRVNKNLTIHYHDLVGDDYRKAICSSKIVLGFLRKINFDTQTSRSFEIPACGSFMLMERTNEHQRLFEEGKEAEYFSSNEELLNKTIYYLKNKVERESIAKNGRLKCESAGYSYAERIKRIISEINKL